MTKERATIELMNEYRAGSEYYEFFRKTVDEFCGEDNRVYGDTMDAIREKLKSMT